MKIRLFLVFIVFLYISSSFRHVYAEPLDLSIYPPITEIITTAETELKASINISNLASEVQKLSITIKPFEAASDDGTVLLMDEKQVDPIKSMLKLGKNGEPINEITLRPSETAHLELAVTIPKTEHIRDYYLTILFQTMHEREIKQSASRIQAAIGTIVLLSIRDPAMQQSLKVRLKNFSTQRLFTEGPINFSLLLENQGSHFVKAQGEIKVFDVSGQEVEKITLPSQNVLRSSARNLTNETPSIQSEKLFGRYKAQAQVHISKDDVLYETITFYVIPKKIAIISLIILFALIGLILRFKSYAQPFAHKKQKTSLRFPRAKSQKKRV